MDVPKIFHQIWIGPRPVPEEYVKLTETWRRFHPDWKISLWNEAALESQPWVPDLPNALSYAAKADILRYYILHEFGGVYIDMDFECLRNVEPLITSTEAFVAAERSVQFEAGFFTLYNNAIIGATPEHPWIAALKKAVLENIKRYSDLTNAAVITGPLFLTEMLFAFPEVTRFPAHLFYPYGPNERWRRYDAFPDA